MLSLLENVDSFMPLRYCRCLSLFMHVFCVRIRLSFAVQNCGEQQKLLHALQIAMQACSGNAKTGSPSGL